MSMLPASWRSYLAVLYKGIKPSKAAFLQQVGVSSSTMYRWLRGPDAPTGEHLERLLAAPALSEQQRKRLELLFKGDPNTSFRLPSEGTPSIPEESQTIAPYYAFLAPLVYDLLRLERESPDPGWQGLGLILRSAIQEVESHPKYSGVNFLVCKCMPPKDGKVRSLRRWIGMGTAPFREDPHFEELFLGSESLAGRAMAQLRCVMIPDLLRDAHWHTNLNPLIDDEGGDHVRSVAAFPIMKQLRGSSSLESQVGVAGILFVMACVPHFFTQERLDILSLFADLIRFPLLDSDFALADSIDLDFMPPLGVQRGHFASFWSRVNEMVWTGGQDETLSMRELPNAEDQVRSLIEDELRHMRRNVIF